MGRGETVRLRDGRQLGVALWGAEDGYPVLYVHGGLGCRLERHREDETYRRLGVRLITVDRPGHGLSDRHDGRRPEDFADDLVEVLESLQLRSVAAVGHSAGGLYVLALAHRHPLRVRVAGIVSGIGIIDRPGGMDDLVPRFQRSYRNARDRPALARIEMRLNVAAFRYRPAFAFRQLSDRAVTAIPEFQRRFREAMLEGACQGVHGFVDDIAVNTGPWGFEPREVSTPVHWWHGDRDSASPLSHAKYVSDRLPHARLETVVGGGHFMIHAKIEEILRSLAP